MNTEYLFNHSAFVMFLALQKQNCYNMLTHWYSLQLRGHAVDTITVLLCYPSYIIWCLCHLLQSSKFLEKQQPRNFIYQDELQKIVASYMATKATTYNWFNNIVYRYEVFVMTIACM